MCIRDPFSQLIDRSLALFARSDDDTFIPDFDAVARLLSGYDPEVSRIIGAMSEAKQQMAASGRIAYGGAGIFVSRGLMARLNAPRVYDECLATVDITRGGDRMVTECAARVLGRHLDDTVTVESTLHQFDIKGDASGWFQSGFLIASLHHWASWFSLFPPWHESGVGDNWKGIMLVGEAAKAVGGDNWGKRYMFEQAKVVVSLGYSVVVHAQPVSEEGLAKSEHTWSGYETRCAMPAKRRTPKTRYESGRTTSPMSLSSTGGSSSSNTRTGRGKEWTSSGMAARVWAHAPGRKGGGGLWVGRFAVWGNVVGIHLVTLKACYWCV